ncbi:hypothetical protein Y032_0003g1691 [Ancylostoma ceylanicum]|uniref:Uncharacterized protein n=1 Tax=Ancylostoma ceylanicum TaxID=53326 RepID=A0A016W0U9_9BILA|nr:hypothetical protein Y032_0003g1691 [Ancylostoma ceylanicum]
MAPETIQTIKFCTNATNWRKIHKVHIRSATGGHFFLSLRLIQNSTHVNDKIFTRQRDGDNLERLACFFIQHPRSTKTLWNM